MTSDLVKRLRSFAQLHEKWEAEQTAAHFREAADRIEALERERQWRPIEDAPKDGTLILAWNGQWMEIAMWQRPNAIDQPMWRGAHCGVSHIHQPTHWMPLPTPPSDK